MPYIGKSPTSAVRRIYTYTATAGQTTFSGASNEGSTLAYVDQNYIDVYLNGILLNSADYTATSGSSIVLAGSGASVSDILTVTVYDVFGVADTVSKKDGGTFDGNVTMGGTLSVTGNQTNTGDVTVNGAFTSQGIDDNADANAITIDSSEQVAIGTTTPVSGKKVTIEASSDQLFLKQTSGDHGYVLDQDNSDGSLSFSRRNSGSDSEKMRIDANGKVLVGRTSAYSDGSIGNPAFQAQAVIGSHNGMAVITSGTTSVGAIGFVNDNGAIGSITMGGTSTAYNTSSDYRLKENVEYTFDATTRLKQLKPCRFNFIADADTTVDGFLAHEVSSVVPEAISGDKDATDDDGNIVPQSIDQSKLVPLLVKTIQELEARITALENA